MNSYSLTYCLDESKVNALLAKATSTKQRESFAKNIPFVPLVYKKSIFSKAEPVQVVTVLEKKEKGYLFYKSIFTFKKDSQGNSYLTGYQMAFESFTRSYIANRNKTFGVLLITGKFSDVTNKDNINLPLPPRPDSMPNYLPLAPSQPLPQAKEEQKTEIKNLSFFEQNKNYIIGGVIVTGVLIAVVVVTK